MYTPRWGGGGLKWRTGARLPDVPGELDPDGGVVLAVDLMEGRVRAHIPSPEGRRWPKGWNSQYIWV